MEEHSVYEMLAQAYVAKDNKPAAIVELEKYVKTGGRNPDTIVLLGKISQLKLVTRRKPPPCSSA